MPYIYLGSTINPDSLSYVDVLTAYANGYFPMGDEDGIVSWFDHEPRGIIPVNDNNFNLKISRSLKQVLKKREFEIKTDRNFYEIIIKCSELHGNTWITRPIISLYTELFNKGYAHCIGAYKNGKLTGGLYGVALKSAFFGESMFYTESNASKACVVHLFDMLRKNKFRLFDIQMITPLFRSFGAHEIAREEYKVLLRKALRKNARFA